MLITSCTTTKIEVKREFPVLDFPTFPLLSGELSEDETEVKFSLDDYVKLAKFKIDYDGLIEYYEKITTLESSE